MAVISATCPRRERGGKVTFTGVDVDGELRDCPDCGGRVAVDPDAREVLHVEAE